MADANQSLRVFISYARADGAAFAEDLLTGLDLAGFDPFLDRHDIAAGEDWETRLANLIQAADTVVFVITPAAVKSERCGWEVQKAQALSKRILPVVAIDVAEADTPETLRRRNYIMFSKGRSFVAGLGELAKALRIDVGWIREHTRVGELAARWAERARSEASLLRGAELDAAKVWLSAWTAPAPEPTELQRAFIGESESAEQARHSAERKQLEEVAAAQAERGRALLRFRRVLVIAGAAVAALLAATAYGGYRVWALNQDLRAAEEHVARAEANIEAEKTRVSEARTQVVEANRSIENIRAQIDRVLLDMERYAPSLDRGLVGQLAELGRRLQERPDIRLTEHFTLADFTFSESAGERGISNAPDLAAFEQLRITAQGLERVRTLLNDCPIEVVSGYRTQALNMAISGSPLSSHLSGYSVDIKCPAFGEPYEIARAIAASPVMEVVDQVLLENGRVVHLSFDPQARGRVQTQYRGPGGRLQLAEEIVPVDSEGQRIEGPAQ